MTDAKTYRAVFRNTRGEIRTEPVQARTAQGARQVAREKRPAWTLERLEDPQLDGLSTEERCKLLWGDYDQTADELLGGS